MSGTGFIFHGNPRKVNGIFVRLLSLLGRELTEMRQAAPRKAWVRSPSAAAEESATENAGREATVSWKVRSQWPAKTNASFKGGLYSASAASKMSAAVASATASGTTASKAMRR